MILIKALVILCFVIMIYINYLSNALPIGGRTQSDISNTYRTRFTPSGFTFSIWGIIYLLVFISIIQFTLYDPQSFEQYNLNLIGIFFILSCLANITWLIAWHLDKILVSTFIMIGLLVILLITMELVQELNIFYITFSIYSGWISIALIANIAILLFKYPIRFFMNYEYLWLGIILIVGVLIASYMVLIHDNYYYGGVFIWAYFGIFHRYQIAIK